MPTTVNRGYSIPATGAEVGVWGSNDLNPNFGTIDTNLGGLSNVALSNANVTLTSSQFACGTIRLSGALTGAVSVIFPAVQGWWTIDNQTTGAFVATITIGSGQVIAVEQGVAADILIDGVNVKFRNLPVVGSYLDVCDATVPAWITACTVPPYLNCDGTTFSAATYPYLNVKLGGNTLPDSRGRNRYALNQTTSRLTTGGAGIDGNTRFASGGLNGASLIVANIPSGIPVTVTGTASVTSISTGGLGNGYVQANGILSSGAPGGANAGLAAPGAITPVQSTGTIAGTGTASGSGIAFANAPPGLVGGITLIRAA